MVDTNDTNSLPHIQQCPKCGEKPKAGMYTDTRLILGCRACGLMGDVGRDARETINKWNDKCDTYMRMIRHADEQFELLCKKLMEDSDE